MKILSWNVRGLGNPRTVNRLKNKLRVINPRILFLIETKLSAKKMEMVRLKCGFENGIDIGSIGSRGGVSLGWKGNLLVSLLSFSSYHVDVEINDTMCDVKWRLTGFYGNPDENGRSESWNLLRRLGSSSNAPWVVLGDFNEITNSMEKKGGRRRPERQMVAFRSALEDCNLTDLGFKGHWFTWERGKFKSTNIRERLDRGVANFNWLEDMGHKMHVWSRNNRRDEKRKRNCLENRLSFLLSQDIPDNILAEIADVQLDLNLEPDKEEIYWEQRTRTNWLKNGDRNISFFHKIASQRKVRNHIAALEDEIGNSFSANEDMLKIAQNYFETLFSASEEGANEHIFELVEKRVTISMNDSLMKQFTEEDIRNAVKSMPPLKAPGVDGDINKTRIVLIPKIDKPKNMSHFRPISLCNVIYKIIAKVLVNRMGEMLGDCINKAQGAFIPGRLISDNVLIAYEVLHSLKMKKRGKGGNFALKLDMSKAYDRVEWDFLAGMLKSLGFHDDWMVLIMRCVTSVSYSISLNGASSGWFSPSRGLRQGDPLSPFLFLICAEDDCILFGDATQEGVCTVRDIIRKYEKSAGQKVNYDKSLIYFGANVKEEVKGDIIRTLGVRVATNPEKYLSLPMMMGRRKAWAFTSYKDRFRKRIDGWSFRFLSMGGKEVFIKSVLQAQTLYTMQCFLFPKALCSQLENIMNKFWWSNNKMKTGIHWSGWNTLCLSKFDGGLGFKKLFLFNKALLAKQVRRVLTQPQCLLARVLKARYFPFSDILATKIGSYPSFTWRSICSARDLIEDDMLWSIGKGDRVNIWNDPWLPERENNRLSGHDIRNRWITANHLMQPDFATWNDKLIRNLFDEVTANRIRSIPIFGSSLEDTIVWKYEGSGTYSVRSGYRVLSKPLLQTTDYNPYHDELKVFYKSLWELKIPDEVESTDHLIWNCGTLRQAPKAGIVKINFDASFLSKENIAITAAIARNFKGSIVGAETYLFQHIADPFVAEARACERALLFARTMGFQRLEVEGDTLSVIKSIKKKGKDTSVIRSITHHTYLMGLSFDQIDYLFTPRSANGAAHALTLEGRRTGYFGFWSHELPSSVISIARKEELQTIPAV
ncbi:reverse transcriptase [Gossypium australe]|uniref:Reverse transcriptase n=1 Tax=Gossypium australe TaxID=47621 RepID=A0A5B6UA53_9ROSI|nr:reverse transcriptase [Gossypium australe]